MSGHHDHHCSHDCHNHKSNKSTWIKAFIGITLGLGLMAISLTGALISPTIIIAIMIFSNLISIYLGFSVFKSAWKSLTQKKLNINILYSISALTIIVISTLSLFLPGLPILTESAPLLLGILNLGEAIEHSILKFIKKGLITKNTKPDNSKTYKIDDEISIKANDEFPVDGILLEDAYIDASVIDGRLEFRYFAKGKEVKQGMFASEDTSIKVTKINKDHDNTTGNKVKPMPIIEKILRYFVPSILIIALVSGVAVSLFFSPSLALQCVLSILVSACPCTFAVITPLARTLSFHALSKLGFSDKEAIDKTIFEKAAKIDTVVFDLNGTLTKGEITNREFKIYEKEDEIHLPNFLSLENKSSHGIAKHIKDVIRNKLHANVEDLEITNIQTQHNGISATINNKQYSVGTSTFVGYEPKSSAQEEALISHKSYMKVGDRIIGHISFNDELKPDAKTAIETLKKKKINIHICTGSDVNTAKAYAKALGIDEKNISAGASREGKRDYITKLQQEKFNVVMIGDAANDKLALNTANLGCRMPNLFNEKKYNINPDIVLPKNGNLSALITLMDLAALTNNNILQNLIISLVYNTAITLISAGVFLACGLSITPALGAGLMIVESAIVLANVYRLKTNLSILTDLPVQEQQISGAIGA